MFLSFSDQSPNGVGILPFFFQMADLFQYMFIISVFIISFGIAFQALLDPNKPVSWSLLVDILWRPYWQMYGELYLEDITVKMGQCLKISCLLPARRICRGKVFRKFDCCALQLSRAQHI